MSMSLVRRFLVAPSLVRLIRKERGGARISEGYFAPQAGRVSYVRVDGQTCHLVLVTTAPDGSSSEERTDVPRAHGDALMDVCSGKAAYDRTALALGGGREALVDRYVAPGEFDLVSVSFDGADEAQGFAVPAWFGPEVSDDPSYERHAVALQGVPQPGEIGLSNAALEAVLDLIEPRFGFGRYGAPKASANVSTGDGDGMMKALRRVAGGSAVAAPVAAEAAPAPAPPADEPAPVEASPEPEAAEAHGQPDGGAETQAETAPHIDSRIDDVIESLSQALGNPQPQPKGGARGEDDIAAEFERWTVRPRRTQQT
jgi:CYTH domain-containing protein